MPDLTDQQRQSLTRWRLVLGKNAEQHGICLDGGDEQAARIEALVGFLFSAPGAGKPSPGDRSGGSGPGHAMNVPRWVDEVGQLFPREAREVITDLLIDDGVTNRGHRHSLLDPRWRYVGIACGVHANYRTVCVMDFASSYLGR